MEEDSSALRVGLSYTKKLSGKALSSIIYERDKKLFSSVSSIYRRTSIERDALKNLIRGGFFDALTDDPGERTRLLAEAGSLPKKRCEKKGQEEMPLEHPATWWEMREEKEAGFLPLSGATLGTMEWEALGLNVRHHPLVPYRQALHDLGVTPSERIRSLPHGTRARAAGLIECLQQPPTKSGIPAYFLTVEDEWGLLQTTIFRAVYQRYGSILHHRRAFLLEGRVEQDKRRGFSFLVERIGDLGEILAGAKVSSPRTTSASGAFLKASRGGRRAG